METIKLFRIYQYEFERKAERETDEIARAYYTGKAEAYELAAFELEHNTEIHGNLIRIKTEEGR